MNQTVEGIHLGCGTMEEMLIIPRAEAPELVQKHSALLMEDGRLSHAARLVARQERLLTNPTLPDDVAVEQVKPVDRKLRQETTSIANTTFDGRRRGARRTRIVNPRVE